MLCDTKVGRKIWAFT